MLTGKRRAKLSDNNDNLVELDNTRVLRVRGYVYVHAYEHGH